ncbi:MAG TPA: DUF885 domain-containing protein [Woeseiaceae bacterium]|nr:DUF885 domain-containing protein [Woeseiaceae bacterium]
MQLTGYRVGFIAFWSLCMLLPGCSPPPGDAVQQATSADADIRAPRMELQSLFDDEWAARLVRDPLFASSMGIHRYNDRLPDESGEQHQRSLEQDLDFLRRLQSIDRTSLPEEEQLNYDLFEFILQSRTTLARYRPHLVPILSDAGFHIRVQRMYEAMPFESVADYERYLARLRALSAYFTQNIENMREGLRVGMTQPKAILDGIEASISGPITENPEDSVFFTPFNSIPQHLDAAERERLRDAGIAAIEEVVIPAYETFLVFFQEEYKPGARDELGASSLPDGEAYYAELVKYFTTLDEATPEGIHRLGLEEVARIRAEMDGIIRQVEFDGSFAEFVDYLRTDSRFYVDEAKDFLKEAAYIAKKIDGQMPAFFRTLPRLPYGIMPVPDDIAPNYTTGRYWGAPIGGRRGGWYMVNTYALDTRPLYELPSLTAHEAVPGHHHQSALRQEIEGAPEFRRAFYPHAFGEGWGLYAEKLGIEFGIYETPYDHFGRLSYEMWRACRLVIDTGIHVKGWTREQAQQYLAENTALSLHNVRTEVDRYIAWPGQALAYKMGELKFLELRERAERELGPAFDIRDFHDVLLLSGGVTLNIVDDQVDRFIQEVKAQSDAPAAH